MKLFVWDDVLCDYSCGIIVALARDVDEARRLVLESLDQDYMKLSVEPAIADEPKVYDTPTSRVVWGGG